MTPPARTIAIFSFYGYAMRSLRRSHTRSPRPIASRRYGLPVALWRFRAIRALFAAFFGEIRRRLRLLPKGNTATRLRLLPVPGNTPSQLRYAIASPLAYAQSANSAYTKP